MIEKGSFRKDLYYRLNVIPVHLPPLRERLEDLADLAEYFIVRFSRTLRKKACTLSPLALDLMRAYSWPGNIRELENILERAVTLIPMAQTVIAPELLPLEVRNIIETSPALLQEKGMEFRNMKEVINRIDWQTLVDAIQDDGSMDAFLKKIEWAMAERAISEYGSKTEAARALKRTYRWIRKLEKEMENKPSA